MILKIAAGRNWARWVALISVTLSVLLIIRRTAHMPSLDLALVGAAACADVIALYLLFFSPGRRWFKRRLA